MTWTFPSVIVMKRYEFKYVLTPEQTDFVTEKLKGNMEEDEYGFTTIASVYYDTPDSRLIRASVENPKFKEKIRVRSYGPATDDSPVFLELKRKVDGVVYKRRIQSTLPVVSQFFGGDRNVIGEGQIEDELRRFCDFYGTLVPACMILYDRTAYVMPESDLRLTIDRDPRYRTEDLDLRRTAQGTALLPEGYAILEIKLQDAIPLWLARILSEGRIYKSSFSKYGTAYERQFREAKRKEYSYV